MSYIDLDALEAWAKEADTYCTILPTNVLALIARVRNAEATIQAVCGLHTPVPVHKYDDTNGEFVYKDDELVILTYLCSECSEGDALERLGDCTWSEVDHGNVYYPCSTALAAGVVVDDVEEVDLLGALARAARAAGVVVDGADR